MASETHSTQIPDPPQWTRFAEEVGQFLENEGMPRIQARVLAWLLVSQPAHQSAEELATGLRSSRGSISMAVQSLQRAGAVERFTVAGSRRTHYRMRPGFWLNEAAQKARLARQWTELADRGMNLLSGPGDDTRRLRETRDVYAFLAEQYERIHELWLLRQKDHPPT
ncbi:MarR family protein [Stackebrandtia albiflava]|uniref:MarR family protein n=1 Tax=Stackebrandtia albiflava TaxID=406432 RepID=A0A562UQH6_9ACTN|nr:MarR family transcriptional regulator [Stackebrandtia albiflava]TWJ07844.1 MarR family protein [Stackebrandtia albiflava]